MAHRPMRVIIVGAGLAGLAIAHGLQRNNMDFVIVDRESAPRDRNWCITMSWALSLLEYLLPAHLFNTINLCQPDPTADPVEVGKYGIAIRDGSTGEIIRRISFPSIRRVNHKKAKKHLSQDLAVQYGKRLVHISVSSQTGNEVTAHFQDGTAETGTLIVGADGGASQVRRWLLGDAASQEVLPCRFMNFSFSLPSEQALALEKSLSPTVEVGAHPKNMYMGISLLDKPDYTRPETWLFYILAAWPMSSNADSLKFGDQLAELRSRMDDWVDPFKNIVDKVSDDISIRYDQLRIWHTKPWNNHRGRVTLVGDAAHSMTFHRGQGGNLAIKDAYELVKLLVSVHKGEVEQKVAVDRYDQGALLRGEEVEISKQCTMGFLDYENIEKSPVFHMGISPAMES